MLTRKTIANSWQSADGICHLGRRPLVKGGERVQETQSIIITFDYKCPALAISFYRQPPASSPTFELKIIIIKNLEQRRRIDKFSVFGPEGISQKIIIINLFTAIIIIIIPNLLCTTTTITMVRNSHPPPPRVNRRTVQK